MYHLSNKFEEVLGILPFSANQSCFLAYDFAYEIECKSSGG